MLTRRTRLLFISRSFPADFDRATYGIFIRMRMFLEGVRPLADELRILFFVDPDKPISEELRAGTEDAIRRRWSIDAKVTLVAERPIEPGTSALAHYVRPVFGARLHPDFSGTAGSEQAAAVAACIDGDVVGIVAHRLGSMWPLLRNDAKLPPVVLDLDEIEHRKFVRGLRAPPFYPGKVAECFGMPALFFGELSAVRRAQMTFVCSQRDCRYLQKLAGERVVQAIPNAVQPPVEVPADPGRETLLFLGSYTYAPNVEAAEDLVTRLWPKIRAIRPEARLLVAGQRPERIPSHSAPPPGVTFTGFVPDLAQLYAQVRVVCCPIRTGGGTRVKIIEATLHGRPVVSLPVGAEGLEFSSPEEIRIVGTEHEFVAACAALLADPEESRLVGAAARRKALAIYDQRAVIRRIRELVCTGLHLDSGKTRQR